jgi:hypothetical protein
MLRRKVRTRTICEWTGMSRAKVDKQRLAHAHEFPDQKLTRPSGSPPTTLREMLRSPAIRCEAAALAGICKALGVIPKEPVPDARRYLPSVSRGEHAMRIHDSFCEMVPSARITLEQLFWLLLALADGESQDVAPCEGCDAALLFCPWDPPPRPCINCSDELWRKAVKERPRRRRRGRKE